MNTEKAVAPKKTAVGSRAKKLPAKYAKTAAEQRAIARQQRPGKAGAVLREGDFPPLDHFIRTYRDLY
jgi:hypothetical protein